MTRTSRTSQLALGLALAVVRPPPPAPGGGRAEPARGVTEPEDTGQGGAAQEAVDERIGEFIALDGEVAELVGANAFADVIIAETDLEPKVYARLTDNWLELTVRFLTGVYGVRDVKDEMSREVLDRLDEVGIGLASVTFEVVGLPPLRVIADDPAR